MWESDIVRLCSKWGRVAFRVPPSSEWVLDYVTDVVHMCAMV